MNISKVKLDGGIMVDYSTINESFRIDSGDDPKSSLFAAAGNLVYAALELFQFSGMQASFNELAISHGDEPGSRLTLKIPTATGDKAKVVCPKVDSKPVIDWTQGGIPVDCPQNRYLDALESFNQEVVEYIRGKRLQMALPFTAEKEDQETEPRAVADSVLAFPR